MFVNSIIFFYVRSVESEQKDSWCIFVDCAVTVICRMCRYKGCNNMKNPSKVAKSEAEDRGYEPCKKCW